MSQKKMTIGSNCRESWILSRPLAKDRTRRNVHGSRKAGHRCRCARPGRSKHGAVETHEEAKRCADLFARTANKSTASSSRCPISATSARSPTPCACRPERPRADPGHARQRRQDDHRRPPRQLLRQDVAPATTSTQYGIPYSLTTLHTVAPDSDRIPAGPRMVRRRLPRRRTAAQAAHRRHRRAPRGVQYGALQREAAGSDRHHRGTARPLRSPRPHRPA